MGIPVHAREPRPRALDRRLDELVELNRSALEVRIAARQLEQARDEVAHLVRLALEVGEEARALLRVEPLVLLQDLDVRLQARERRSQLV